MIKEFKNEFENLDKNEIIQIVNRCAGKEVCFKNIEKMRRLSSDTFGAYSINYVQDDDYGFWCVQYGYKQIYYCNMPTGSGFFQYQIKITPFNVVFEQNDIAAPKIAFEKTSNKKNLEDNIQLHIYKKCPHYKKAIIDATKQFLTKLNPENKNQNIEEELL